MTDNGQISIRKLANISTLNSKPEDKINYLSFSQLEEHRPYELHKEIGST